MDINQTAQQILGVDVSTLKADVLLLGIPGFDSIKLMKIIVALEKKSGRRFTAQEVTALKTWGDLVQMASRTQN